MRSVAICCLMGCCLMGLAAGAYGQAKLEFEVASIRPAEMPKPIPGPNGGMMVMRAGGNSGGPGSNDPSRVSYRGATVTSLLMTAYEVKRYQISGPAWMDQDRWDITAKVPEGASKEDTKIMLQNLLADRFKVTLHREKKEMPVYDLVTKGNVKLTESPEDPPPSPDAPPPAPPAGGPLTFTRGPDGNMMPVFPQSRNTTMMMINGNATLNAKKETMDSLANRLSQQLSKPVTNSTGLGKKYDFTLSWSTEGLDQGMGMGAKMAAMSLAAGAGGGGGGGGGGVPQANTPQESAPNLFAAVQSLGLKLEAKKAPVDLLVIDHLEKTPTEN